ncbi:MAG: hypothetical protein JW908_07380 [Anaerolineales bacterium]|nr:hypothetical protein [Anaerolineales bacterium]
MEGFIHFTKRIAFGGILVLIVIISTALMYQPVGADSSGSDGPGGVGSTDGSSPLSLWLKSDAGIYIDDACTTTAGDGNSVACWEDQSGNNHQFIQSTSGNQPTFSASGLNNWPILQFNGGSHYLEKSYTSDLNTNDFTVFIVARTTGGDASLRSPYASHCSASGFVFYASDSDYWNFWAWKPSQWSKQIVTSVDITNWHILNGYYGASLYDSQYFDIDGTNYKSNIFFFTKNESCPARVGAGDTDQASPSAYFNGEIAEIIIYNAALTMAERTLVNNYLNSKYDIVINGDHYAGVDPYIYEVAGIGMEDGSHTQGSSAGMIVSNSTFLQENGDYILIGHGNVANNNTTNDLPSGGDWTGSGLRWTRDWFLTKTDKDTTGGAVNISFDISDSGMSGSFAGSASNYRLLKRTGASGDFSDIASAASISGDQVLFSNVDVSLLGSYFTLGTVDSAASPTAVSLQDFQGGSQKLFPGIALALGAIIIIFGLFLGKRRRVHRL